MKTHLLILACVPLIAFAAPNGPANGRGFGRQNNATTSTANNQQASQYGPGSANCLQQGGEGQAGCAQDGAGWGRRGGRRGFGAQGQRGGGDGACIAASTTTVTTLPAAELIAGLEEERLAHDLYTAAAAKWSTRAFSNIARSETRHATALTNLANNAGVTLPPNQPGTYTTAEIQSLYAALRPLVDESEVAALRVGALVEETDIVDLRNLLAGELDQGTRTVISNLERASRHHLMAFVRNLSARGVEYTPQVLSAEDYAAIIGG